MSDCRQKSESATGCRCGLDSTKVARLITSCKRSSSLVTRKIVVSLKLGISRSELAYAPIFRGTMSRVIPPIAWRYERNRLLCRNSL